MEVINQESKESEIVEQLEILGKFNCSRDIVAEVFRNSAEYPNALKTFFSKYDDLRDSIPINSLRYFWEILNESDYEKEKTIFKEKLLPKLIEFLVDKNDSVRYHTVRFLWKGSDKVADAIKNKPETKKILENLVHIFEWNTETIETKEYVLSTLHEIALELPKKHEQRNRIAGWFEKMIEQPHFYGITKDGENEIKKYIDEIMKL